MTDHYFISHEQTYYPQGQSSYKMLFNEITNQHPLEYLIKYRNHDRGHNIRVETRMLFWQKLEPPDVPEDLLQRAMEKLA